MNKRIPANCLYDFIAMTIVGNLNFGPTLITYEGSIVLSTVGLVRTFHCWFPLLPLQVLKVTILIRSFFIL
jgi:hypothetical protein